MFKIALPFSICASEKGTYKREVLQNPKSGIDPKWGVFLQGLPECSALNAETLHQVPAWVPDTPASRADLSALYTTLSRLDQVRDAIIMAGMPSF